MTRIPDFAQVPFENVPFETPEVPAAAAAAAPWLAPEGIAV